MSEIEPLEADTWFRAIRSLAERARSSSSDLEEQLRHAYHLVQLTPTPLREFIRADCDEERFEQFLSCQAFVSAALALLSQPVKYSATRGADDQVLVIVALPDDTEGEFAASSEFASAVLQAWTQAIVNLDARALKQPRSDRTDRQSHPDQHISQLGPRLKSTGH